jgi:hypothetical protein
MRQRAKPLPAWFAGTVANLSAKHAADRGAAPWLNLEGGARVICCRLATLYSWSPLAALTSLLPLRVLLAPPYD